MNKQSNLYTVLYIVVLVVVVGAALAITSMSLQSRQRANADADKMLQILTSVHITPAPSEVIATYREHITDSYVVDAQGQRVAGDAFDIDVAAQTKEPLDKRLLPVYEAKAKDGSTKYVLPMYGAGLWGPIWGYISLNADASTVYGAYFAHQGETPGLGAEIEKPEFRNQFDGKELFKGTDFLPIAVVKAGQHPAGNEDYVDGISGGTITSKGVGAMIDDCLSPYAQFLTNLRNSK